MVREAEILAQSSVACLPAEVAISVLVNVLAWAMAMAARRRWAVEVLDEVRGNLDAAFVREVAKRNKIDARRKRRLN